MHATGLFCSDANHIYHKQTTSTIQTPPPPLTYIYTNTLKGDTKVAATKLIPEHKVLGLQFRQSEHGRLFRMQGMHCHPNYALLHIQGHVGCAISPTML
jgi:hypothetical protein